MSTKTNKILSVVLAVVVIVVIVVIAYYFKQNNDYTYPEPVLTNEHATSTPHQTDTTWKTYSNAAQGLTFQYPASFNSDYASFQNTPKAFYATTAGTDSGCYVPQGVSAGTLFQTKLVINNINFCLSTTTGVGAGQLYTTYYFTTRNLKTYATLEYTVHTPNGCGAYGMETDPAYQKCQVFFNNYKTIVEKPIVESAGTLKFTK